MQELIKDIYNEINFLGFNATYHHKQDYVEGSKALFPKIQEFIQWFMDEWQSVFERGVYDNLADILKDCERAIKNHDYVLMMDALEQGISGYLEMFLPEEFFRERENIHIGKVETEES